MSSCGGIAGGLGVGGAGVVVVDAWRRSHGCWRVWRHERQSHREEGRKVGKREVVGFGIESGELDREKGWKRGFTADTPARDCSSPYPTFRHEMESTPFHNSPSC